uniref:Uncharacterized protein n=1 Tax=Vespula pensylvanica TaxID=30213 RepID=A0A834U573_VESPE|nr:hypothetical protein H0235_011775 [Vespula pensylvanica]
MVIDEKAVNAIYEFVFALSEQIAFVIVPSNSCSRAFHPDVNVVAKEIDINVVSSKAIRKTLRMEWRWKNTKGDLSSRTYDFVRGNGDDSSGSSSDASSGSGSSSSSKKKRVVVIRREAESNSAKEIRHCPSKLSISFIS